MPRLGSCGASRPGPCSPSGCEVDARAMAAPSARRGNTCRLVEAVAIGLEPPFSAAANGKALGSEGLAPTGPHRHTAGITS